MLNKINRKIRNNKGFTLVELVIVVAILGVLAGLVVPKLSGIVEDSKKRTDLANAKTIAGAVAVLMAQGDIKIGTSNKTITVNTTNTSGEQQNLANYLQTIPRPKAASAGSYFYVHIAGGTGDISIRDSNNVNGGNQLYPVPDGIYAGMQN